AAVVAVFAGSRLTVTADALRRHARRGSQEHTRHRNRRQSADHLLLHRKPFLRTRALTLPPQRPGRLWTPGTTNAFSAPRTERRLVFLLAGSPLRRRPRH